MRPRGHVNNEGKCGWTVRRITLHFTVGQSLCAEGMESAMRVLVTWASKRGGTEDIARDVGETLRYAGFDVELLPADAAETATGFDAAIVGGALYAGRWPQAARRFVRRRAERLRRVPVWFFSSGPLDESADHRRIAPTRAVQTLMDSVGAQGHVTFGGRLSPDARGFPASAMAKTHAGDWRNPEHIRAWATAVAHDLPTARPRVAVAPPGGSVWRVASTRRKVLWGIGILVAVMLGFGSWYKIHYSMGTAREFEVNSRSTQPRVLLATQGSDFKDSIVRGIVEHLKQRPAHVRVIDVGALHTVDEADWDAIVVIHTWEMRQPQRDAKEFIDRLENMRKVVLMSTSGAGTFKMDGVDEISAASIRADVPARVAEIDSRLDGILDAQGR